MKINWKNGSPKRTKIREKDGVPYLVFDPLEREKWLFHAFSTRLGGVGTGDAASMNFSFEGSFSKKEAEENFRRFAHAAGFDEKALVLSDQTHTTNVRRVDRNDAGRGWCPEKEPFSDVDGFVTNEPDLILATFYADCVPLYFADPVHRAIGLSHSGWRGTAHRMGERTVERMRAEFGTDPADLLCVIGPSVCADCYEVGEEFPAYFSDPEFAGVLKRAEDGRLHLDLWEANRRILLAAGLREERIFLPELCTCCNPSFLFSYRASGGRCGHLGAFFGIRPEA